MGYLLSLTESTNIINSSETELTQTSTKVTESEVYSAQPTQLIIPTQVNPNSHKEYRKRSLLSPADPTVIFNFS